IWALIGSPPSTAPLTYLQLASKLPFKLPWHTYSHQLVREINGVHFWLDQWLITLYGRYSIEAIGHDEHVRRVLACRDLIRNMADELLRRGIDVVLDDGFFLREHRKQYIDWA